MSLGDVGVDSLMAVEMRRWWRRELGVEVSVVEIMGAGTIGEMGGRAVEGLRGRFGEGRGD